jgi:hypothetical protein
MSSHFLIKVIAARLNGRFYLITEDDFTITFNELVDGFKIDPLIGYHKLLHT